MTVRKRVSVIPPIEQFDRTIKVKEKKQRVAAYCRVSTLHGDQETSYEGQISHYTDQIANNPKWSLVKIYADEGISGTATNKRSEFNKMVQDCINGKIDLVLTKSVSRFARNTVDSLNTIRTLKEKGVGIYFEKENVNTLDSKGELMITFLSSQAQEESRNISENVSWSVKRRFEKGKVIVNHNKFLGYTKDENGELIIVPEEAVIVRRIFKEYIEGASLLQIKRSLENDGIKTVTGNDKWNVSVIKRILSNEKHCGDALLQKSITVDFLTHKRIKNNGAEKQYYIENNHEGIVSKEIFRLAQAEQLRRSTKVKTIKSKENKGEVITASKHSSKYALTGMIVCGESKHNYKRQTWSKYGVKKAVWRCEDRLKNGAKSKCIHSPTINEVDLHRKIMEAINDVITNDDKFVATFRDNIVRIVGSKHDPNIKKMEDEIISIQKQIVELIEQCSNNADSDEFMKEIEHLQSQIKDIEEKRDTELQILGETKEVSDTLKPIDKVIDASSNRFYLFNEQLVKQLISKITVKYDGSLIIQFISGIVVSI